MGMRVRRGRRKTKHHPFPVISHHRHFVPQNIRARKYIKIKIQE
jgi:hypothetical protein